MAYVITDACANEKDGGCVVVCPVDCIHPTPDEPGFTEADQLYIDPNTCTDCGMCVDECPVRAIFAEEDLPSQLAHFAQINADWYAKQNSDGQ